ncbi:hypothetical protein [Paenibacillus odorifer]|nr:hypothetical protein [Paenibacillus odorifer]
MEEVVELIKESVEYLLGAELLEENGWTKEKINILKKISREDFEILFK